MSTLENTALSRPRPPDFVPGYRLEKVVGKGGMGEVHRATQLSLGRTVAVKLLASDLANDESFVSRFQKEAAALAALSHPNIVSIVDKGKADGTYYLVMEFVDGPSLREVMRSPLFDAATALRVMLEICRAIEYAHSRGVIHRDLKPENILFDEQSGGHAKVSDFGLASFLDDASARFNLTQTHVSMGTLSYMAPEQRIDAKTADGRADIFSLGVILYELLVGEVPLGTFDPPSQKKPEVDPRLDAIVQRCLKPDPADRYQKLSDLVADLLPSIQVTLPPVKASMTTGQRVVQGTRRFFRGVVLTFGFAILCTGLAAIGLSHYERTRPLPPTFTAGELVQELPNMVAVTAQGRVDRGDQGVAFAVGDGPDGLSFIAAGREVLLEGDALEFLDEGETAIGRLRVDMTDLGGDTVRLFARVKTVPPRPSRWRELKRTVLGPQVPAEASLILSGRPGHFAALTRRANDSELSLEWALGARVGRMIFPITDMSEELPLELSVSEGGVLRAFVGHGKQRKPVGEAIALGSEWEKVFGEEPRPSVACRGETCRFGALRFEARRRPPPPPPPPEPEPVVVQPAKAPVQVKPAQTKPASTTTKKAPPPDKKSGKKPR